MKEISDLDDVGELFEYINRNLTITTPTEMPQLQHFQDGYAQKFEIYDTNEKLFGYCLFK